MIGNQERISFTARLVMESDWHVGTGAGRSGGVDRLVARDPDGLPYVPAKTLTGIWRDACEVVARALDDGDDDGPWSSWLEYLFGSQPSLAKGPVAEPPRPAALSVGPAYLPEPLRHALDRERSGALELREALTFVKPGVTIDEASGRAKEHFLRFEEMARVEAVLEATCSLALPDDDGVRESAFALLTAGACLVERLGAKRRRGAGRCRMELPADMNRASAADWLRDHKNPPPVPDQPTPRTGPSDAPEVDGDGWVEIRLSLTLQSPLCVTHQTIGNVVKSLDFLPGHHLLPLLSKICEELNVDLSQAIARGDVLVLPATIDIGGHRGRPVPFALAVPKGSKGFETAGDIVNLLALEDDNPDPLKPIRTGYIGPSGDRQLPVYVQVPKAMRTHNTVDDADPRPSEHGGGVYSYEAIEPGVRLRTVIRMRRGLHDALSAGGTEWWTALAGEYTLGRSKKDDYGRVLIEVDGAPGDVPIDGASDHSFGKGDEFVMWCLSDVLLRDEGLRPSNSAESLARAISSAVVASSGTTLKLQPVAGRVYLRTRRLESWQARWGLPRPSLVAIAAGSCAIVRVVEGTVKTSNLNEIALHGLAERRAEGYGQVTFDDPLLLPDSGIESWLTSVTPATTPGPEPTPELIGSGDGLQTYAETIEREAWRNLIRRHVQERAYKPEFRAKELGWLPGDRPPASQLNALREVTHGLEEPSRDSPAARWLDHLEAVKNRREKWPGRALQEIRRLFTEPDTIWESLMDKDAWPTLTDGGDERLRRELWPEAVQALLDESVRQHVRARSGATAPPGERD